ncbi:MAG TPA: TonB family protein [Thermoanaerobaculia bacterium]|jgi:TonB family protein
MPENILVVEYEPRYTDRVRQALTGQPYSPAFAKDGEEALRVLSADAPKLIVLSSVVPKISTGELIRAIRNQGKLAATPILLTVSGYNGNSPKADAQRLGASDILPKPYSESEFLGKVQQLLPAEYDQTVAAPGVRKTMAKQSDDLDKMLADTLAGVMPQKKTQAGGTPTTPAPKPPAPAPPLAPSAAPHARTPESQKPRSASDNLALDKMLSDTLSGLDRTVRVPRPTPPAPQAPPVAPRPVAPPAPSAAAAKPSFATEKIPVVSVDKMPVSSPVLAPVPPPAHVEEDEPRDGIKFGQYVLLEKIAVGGMAEVWKARMRGVEGFQKIVAIKKILPHLSDNQDFIEMFIDEAKLAAQLNHNNIIHIYDLGKIQSSYYIAMEYVDGSDLKTILKRAQERDQPMSIELGLFVASKIASALDYAHRKRDFDDHELGLVHRDVSPQNVLISEEGDIKLCDFGIAKAASKASHTQAGALKGKLQYMSPEQAWGKHIDKRSDIFALATVLFEMLTGRRLFTGDNELSILEQVREARVTAPSQFNDEVTPEIDAIVLKALQKEPDKRYQTAGEMARDLDQVLYSFKPTPTSADLAIYMHRLGEEAPTPLHTPEPEPFVPPPPPKAAHVVAAPVAAAPVMPIAAPAVAQYDQAPKKSNMLPAIIGAAVVVLGIVAFFLMRGKGNTAAPATTTAKPIAAAPSNTTVPIAAVPLTASSPTTAVPTSTAPDQAKVDEEVRKRLEMERLKLEQQNKTQQAAQPAQAAPVVSRPTPTPVPVQAAQTTPVAPLPVPVPVAPVPQPVEARPTPAPQPAAAEAPKLREGDLVPPGTEGLTPAHIIHQAVPTYPPLARAQRVEGTVIVNVLVSEAGRVLDARVLSGVNRPVGINESALQAVRNSSFASGMKEGVRVKSWTTVVVAFKL